MARFVLVHGAFHGAWCWEPVMSELKAARHTAVAIDLPGCGDDATPVADVTLDAYAERVCEALGTDEEPAVLVGHSMGGIAITQAAARCPDRIASLVYVAAFLPADGQSLVDLTQLPEGAGDMVQANMVVEGDPPVATMPSDVALEAFYGMCDPERAAWGVERIRAQALAPFVTPVSLGDREQAGPPSYYVIALQDRSIPPALQRRMAHERATAEVAELDCDHSPFLSAPAALGNLLDRFAQCNDVSSPSATRPR
jgi:pimeloyl-ACP methyl ester carboxylesterase